MSDHQSTAETDFNTLNTSLSSLIDLERSRGAGGGNLFHSHWLSQRAPHRATVQTILDSFQKTLDQSSYQKPFNLEGGFSHTSPQEALERIENALPALRVSLSEFLEVTHSSSPTRMKRKTLVSLHNSLNQTKEATRYLNTDQLYSSLANERRQQQNDTSAATNRIHPEPASLEAPYILTQPALRSLDVGTLANQSYGQVHGKPNRSGHSFDAISTTDLSPEHFVVVSPAPSALDPTSFPEHLTQSTNPSDQPYPFGTHNIDCQFDFRVNP